MTSNSWTRTHRATLSRRGALTGAAVLLAAAATPTRAAAQIFASMDFLHVIDLAGRQRMLSQRLSKEMALIALGHDVAANLLDLTGNRARFARVLTGMRLGDGALGLPRASDPAVLENLARIEELWPAFDFVIGNTLAAGAVPPNQIDTMADVNLPLLDALQDTIQSYEALASSNRLTSIMAVAMEYADGQRTLSQRMSKEFFMIALDHRATINRRSLGESVARFDLVLDGLFRGNPQLQLLPAPTPEILNQLGAAHETWNRLRPIMANAANGAPIDADRIARVAGLNLEVLADMDAIVGMYATLVSRA